MMANCKECGCLCSLCNTNSLDLHHDIEVLKASVKEAKMSANNLRNEVKEQQEVLEETKKQHQLELDKMAEQYERLKSNHRRLEVVNHELEDKILLLVQENEAERKATMAIHEDIHQKLKLADKKVEDALHEKDTLAAQSKVVVDMLRKYQTGIQLPNDVQVSRELSRLSRTIVAHETKHPVLAPEKDSSPSRVPIMTYPPVAAFFDNSPKPIRRHVLNKPSSTMSRNASESRLANMASHPTDITLCYKCKDVSWTRHIATQTCEYDRSDSFWQPAGIKSRSVVFDV